MLYKIFEAVADGFLWALALLWLVVDEFQGFVKRLFSREEPE